MRSSTLYHSMSTSFSLQTDFEYLLFDSIMSVRKVLSECTIMLFQIGSWILILNPKEMDTCMHLPLIESSIFQFIWRNIKKMMWGVKQKLQWKSSFFINIYFHISNLVSSVNFPYLVIILLAALWKWEGIYHFYVCITFPFVFRHTKNLFIMCFTIINVIRKQDIENKSLIL